jgi:hypothetical protein
VELCFISASLGLCGASRGDDADDVVSFGYNDKKRSAAMRNANQAETVFVAAVGFIEFDQREGVFENLGRLHE